MRVAGVEWTAAVRPTGPLFDIVLLAHIVCVLVSVVVVGVSGVQARRLGRLDEATLPEGELARYYAPGVNIAGRTLYAVPVLGFILLGLSHGFFGLDESWVMSGLVLWLVAAGLAEGVLWPAERHIQRALATATGVDTGLRRAARHARASASAVVVVLVAATFLMLVQP